MRLRLSLDLRLDTERGVIEVTSAGWGLSPPPARGYDQAVISDVAQALAAMPEAPPPPLDAPGTLAQPTTSVSAASRAQRPCGVALPAARGSGPAVNPFAGADATVAGLTALGVSAAVASEWLAIHGPERVGKVLNWVRGVMAKQSVSDPTALMNRVLATNQMKGAR